MDLSTLLNALQLEVYKRKTSFPKETYEYIQDQENKFKMYVASEMMKLLNPRLPLHNGMREYINNAHAGSDGNSKYNIGLCLELGIIVEKNLQASLEWYTKAAQHMHIKSIRKIAKFYEYGWRVSQDFTLSGEWYNIADGLEYTPYSRLTSAD